MTPDEAKKHLGGPLGEEMLKAVSRHVAPVFWIIQDADGTEFAPNNGTAFLFDAGRGPFLVTANHVYEGYLAARTKHPLLASVILPMSHGDAQKIPLRFDFEARLISQLRDPDIATFRITPREVEQLQTTIVTKWPPLVPTIGQVVAFAGFPGHQRKRISPFELSFTVHPCLAIATSVNDRHISCQFDQERSVETQGLRLPPPQFKTGGMSGGPLFTVADPEDPSSWHLGGVIALGSPALDILRACPADRLQPDGTLLR